MSPKMNVDGVILTISVDASGAVAGSSQAGAALDGLNNKAQGLGRNLPLVNQRTLAVGNAIASLSGIGGTAGKALTLVAQGANTVQSAMMGLLGPVGIAITAFGLLAGAVISYVQDAEKAKKASVEMGDSIATLHEQAMAAVDMPKITYADTFDNIKNKINELKVEIDLLSGKQVEIGPGKTAVIEGDLTKYANRLGEAKRELSALEMELSAMEYRATVKRASEMAEFLKNARMNLEDMPIPEPEFKRLDPVKIPVAFDFKPDVNLLAKLATAMGPAGMAIDIPVQLTMQPTLEELKLSLSQFKATPLTLPKLPEKDNTVLQSIEDAQKGVKEMREDWQEEGQSMGAGFANTMTNSLNLVFQGGQEGFENMLKMWAQQLLMSAVFSLLMMLLNPGKSFMSFFSGALGFQHGTSFVPHTGLAIVHRGEAIIPASQNIYNQSIQRNVNSGANQSTVWNVVINGVTDPLELAQKLELLTKRRQTRFVLEG